MKQHRLEDLVKTSTSLPWGVKTQWQKWTLTTWGVGRMACLYSMLLSNHSFQKYLRNICATAIKLCIYTVLMA